MLALLGAACGGGAQARPRPVIMISIDSLRADHCSAYGYRAQFAPEEPTTPFLDRMAAEGVRFAAASAPTSWTLPSHMTLVTGMDCFEHGVRQRGVRLDPDTEHIAGRLRRAGYATGGFYSAPFLHPSWGFGQGFDHYEGAAAYLQDPNLDAALADPAQGALKPAHDASHEDKQCSERVIDAALAWLEEGRKYERPFFLFLHLWDPHYDYEPPAAYAERFHPGYAGGVDGRGFMDPQRRYAREELDHVLALYDAEIRYTDDQIARLWAQLERWGVAGDVILSISSDHGDEFYEHGQKGHQKTLYEEVVHVPLVLRAPGLAPAGASVTGSVGLLDVAPTLLELAGVSGWPERSGRSLRPLWERAGGPGRAVLLDLDMNENLRWRGYREGQSKYLHAHRRPAGEIYDLEADPGEQRPQRLQSSAQNAFAARAEGALAAAEARLGRTRPMHETAAMSHQLSELGYGESHPETDADAEPSPH